jgi:hypothetical protein
VRIVESIYEAMPALGLENPVTVADIPDTQSHQVAGPQFVIDRQIKHG